MKLDFCRKAMGARLAAKTAKTESIQGGVGLERATLKSIADELCKRSSADLARISELDLSYCDIFDQDLPAVLTIVELLPKCAVLNLTGTSLNSASAAVVQQFTTRPSLEYLLIAGTGLASINGRSMFAGLKEEDLKKIVFLASNMLSSRTWKNTVRNTDHHPIVVETHCKFFELPAESTPTTEAAVSSHQHQHQQPKHQQAASASANAAAAAPAPVKERIRSAPPALNYARVASSGIRAAAPLSPLRDMPPPPMPLPPPELPARTSPAIATSCAVAYQKAVHSTLPPQKKSVRTTHS